MKTKDVDLLSKGQYYEIKWPKGSRWAAVEENNTWHFFPNEKEACAFQRGYRAGQGLDPMTGE